MMYQEKMACAIKVDGQVLREFKDQVFLPFGSEYSIFLKNLHSKRAIVHIEIDGVKVSEGGFIVNPNSTLDVERFVKDLNVGNRFKFIERTTSIENHRGIGVEDGLIRIEFEYEIDRQVFLKNIDWSKFPIGGAAGPNNLHVDAVSNIWLSSPLNGSCATVKSMSSDVACASAHSDVGITVPGSISDQKFIQTEAFPTDNVKHVMVFKLLGQTPTNQVAEPVTVKSKPECKYCGKLNKHDAKFCNECGASLQIV